MQETISNQQAINKQRYHYNDYTLTLEYDPETCFNSTCLMEKGTIVYAKTSMSISPELASELEISSYALNSFIETIPTSKGEYQINFIGDAERFIFTSTADLKKEIEAQKKISALFKYRSRLPRGIFSLLLSPKIANKEKLVITDPKDPRFLECQTLKEKYRSLVNLMPYYTASSSIEQASQLINSYIATQKLDTLAMQNIITTLNSVSHITPISIPLLQNFLDNPTSCDLRDLTEKLNYSLKNLNNIIELKSETNER